MSKPGVQKSTRLATNHVTIFHRVCLALLDCYSAVPEFSSMQYQRVNSPSEKRADLTHANGSTGSPVRPHLACGQCSRVSRTSPMHGYLPAIHRLNERQKPATSRRR